MATTTVSAKVATKLEDEAKASLKSIYQATWAETVFFGIGFGFIIFWSFGHGSTYFFWTPTQMFEDFKKTLFVEGVHPAIVAEGFRDCCLNPIMQQPRLNLLRLHIALAASSGLMMIMQLLPQVRTRDFKRHRKIGYLVFTLVFVFILQMTYFLFFRGLGELPDVIYWFDVIAYIAIVIGYIAGGIAIANRNIKLHRSMMMLCSAGMLMNAVQRFFWTIFSKLDTTPTTFEEWVDGPLTYSSLVTIVVNLGVALYYGAFTMPLASDMIRARSSITSKKVA